MFARRIARWSLVLTALTAISDTGLAQAAVPPVPPGRVPVLVALVDTPVHGASALVMRRRNSAGRVDDAIIVLNDQAAATHLAAAAATLAAMMADEGDDAPRMRLIRIPDNATGPQSELRAAARVASRAAAAPEVTPDP